MSGDRLLNMGDLFSSDFDNMIRLSDPEAKVFSDQALQTGRRKEVIRTNDAGIGGLISA